MAVGFSCLRELCGGVLGELEAWVRDEARVKLAGVLSGELELEGGSG